jgi:hypothetical protein
MLYYKSKNENNNNQDYIPECCPQPGPGTPQGCDCCYDSWTIDLIMTTNSYKEWDAKATKRQKLYDGKSGWTTKLKNWHDDLESVDQKAEAILRQLEIFIAHLNKICKITEQSNEAIEILFCMIEDLYIRVDDLKEEYDELMNCIASAAKTNSELTNGIVTCLTEYGKKLDAVIATRDVLIQSISSVIEVAYKLHEYLCLNEKHCGEEKIDYGLINILIYWKGIFNGTITINHGECKFSPCITFPIDTSEYYKKLDHDWKRNKEELTTIKHDLDHAKEKRAAFLACKESLEKAISEVDPKVKCK